MVPSLGSPQAMVILGMALPEVRQQHAGCDPVTRDDLVAGQAPATEAHEVSACYDNLRITRDGRNSPTLECSCGRFFSADNWEEAGIELDGHLADVTP